MNPKYFIYGLSGRMGQEVEKRLKNAPNKTYLGGTSQSTPFEPDQSPDLVIDFSLPGGLDDLIAFCQRHHCALVSGTTGLNEQQQQKLQDLGQELPVFWSANMSFGVYLMCQLTEHLARYDQFFNYNIEETHHIHKKDKPSGTAIMIEKAAKKSTQSLGETVSHRVGDVYGIHSFTALSPMEKIEVRHEALDRGLFAQGAVDVASWLLGQDPGYYTMADFFQDLDK